jgi:hypothetical protein
MNYTQPPSVTRKGSLPRCHRTRRYVVGVKVYEFVSVEFVSDEFVSVEFGWVVGSAEFGSVEIVSVQAASVEFGLSAYCSPWRA